jgi:hypothetical protein
MCGSVSPRRGLQALLDDLALAPRAAPPSSQSGGASVPFNIVCLASASAEHSIADHTHDLRCWDDAKERLSATSNAAVLRAQRRRGA